MIKFRIKNGKKYFRPYRFPMPVLRPKGFTLEFKIEEGSWSSKEEWGGDDDWNDWMKLGGLTSFFSKNDVDALLAAFRYGYERETYEVTGYTNWPKSKFNFGKEEGEIAIVNSGVWNEISVKIKNGEAIYRLPDLNHMRLPFEQVNIMRKVSPYPGGSNNSEGEFGGRAFKDMSIRIILKAMK